MPDRYDPPTDPQPWTAFRPTQPSRPADGPYRDYPTQRTAQYNLQYDEPAGEARTQGLRRMSKLTWRATQLSAVAAVGFAALFAHSAHAQTVSTQTPVKPSAKPAPTPSPTKTHKKKHHKKKHAPTPVTAPAGSGSTGSPGGGAAPSPTLAPPTTAPAPPPPSPTPSAVQTTSSGSSGG